VKRQALVVVLKTAPLQTAMPPNPEAPTIGTNVKTLPTIGSDVGELLL
jgi:hypothetical protein